MSRFTEQKIIWLEAFLIDRFGIALKLEPKGDQLFLYLLDKGDIIIFDSLNPDFHQFGSSNLNCMQWNPASEGFLNVLDEDLYAPGLSVQKVFEFKNNILHCHYDILGLVFWCLNRLEEIKNHAVDDHGRFPFVESHAFKNGYIEYPIVDQWLDILKQSIEKIYKKNILIIKNGESYITHDIDRPARYYFSGHKQFFKSVLADLIREKNLISFFGSFSKFFSKKIPQSDPYNTFDWLMDISEKYNKKSNFYFICGGDSKYDANYNIASPQIVKVINEILKRGHIVGLHPSYCCYLDSGQMIKEINALKSILPKGTQQMGGRMHYLRFKYPETLHNLVSAGMKYDSTLGYAEHIGFRCGTSHSYYPFDPLSNLTINLRVYPLIVMDGTLTTYMKMCLGDTSTFNKVDALIKRCKKFEGNFVLLWHNSELKNEIQKKFYERVVSIL